MGDHQAGAVHLMRPQRVLHVGKRMHLISSWPKVHLFSIRCSISWSFKPIARKLLQSYSGIDSRKKKKVFNLVFCGPRWWKSHLIKCKEENIPVLKAGCQGGHEQWGVFLGIMISKPDPETGLLELFLVLGTQGVIIVSYRSHFSTPLPLLGTAHILGSFQNPSFLLSQFWVCTSLTFCFASNRRRNT